MKLFFRLLVRMVKLIFIVFVFSLLAVLLFIGSLFFREQKVPEFVLSRVEEAFVPSNLVVHAESVAVGFKSGVHVRNLKVYDREAASLEPIASVFDLAVNPIQRRAVLEGLVYKRLPAGYYAPGNAERNESVKAVLPRVETFSLVLIRPDVLSVRPERVVADVTVEPDRLSVDRIRLDWPDKDEPMALDGFCTVDLREQLIEGEVRGSAKQHHIRPMLVALDIPSALPYMDGFTEVPGKVPARCGWKVNLVNSDFDLDLDLDPNMGKYNLVPMRHATGNLKLHVYTRGQSLNYHHVIGPIVATGARGQPLEGTVTVDGFEGTNTVKVTAKSALPAADLLKIGGFTGDYVSDDVFGESSCDLEFRFPRTMGSDLSLLNGKGHVTIKDGQVMRLKGFKGLLDLLAEKVPGVSWMTDSTQASGDYTIDRGILRSDNIYIEGSVFSLKMWGSYDTVADALDFTVRVQFTKKDSTVGKILHPLTLPFTKLLLEFRVTGSTEKPKWKYLSVVERVLEVAK